MGDKDNKLPDTLAEVQDKEAEKILKDKNVLASEKVWQAGQILTTADARNEADLESEQIRQNTQRKYAADAAEEAAEEAAPGPDKWTDIRSPKPKE